MQLSEFDFHLPEDLIAQYPLKERAASRLLHCASDGLHDRRMVDLPGLLEPGDLLVFNDTRVIKARLFGAKQSGGKVEALVERLLDERRVLAQLRASHSPAAGAELSFAEGVKAKVRGRHDSFFELEFDRPVMAVLESQGRLPLPPYIEHAAGAADEERYQTLFARQPGAVAAPTAGLHFDENLLRALAVRGIDTATLTLHVGAGTFQPVRVENLAEHVMHMEWYDIPPTLIDKIAATRARGGRVVAVGTTVLRSLESAAAAWAAGAAASASVDGAAAAASVDSAAPAASIDSAALAASNDGAAVAASNDTAAVTALCDSTAATVGLAPGPAETRLFITPGYRFRVVDRLVTNFHLPKSTLLMLVSAFAGTERIRNAYRHAIAERYRFFSYGDAMLLEPCAERLVDPSSKPPPQCNTHS